MYFRTRKNPSKNLMLVSKFIQEGDLNHKEFNKLGRGEELNVVQQISSGIHETIMTIFPSGPRVSSPMRR